MVPIIELRGSIPVGCGLGLDAIPNLICAMLGNLLPVPFILLFIPQSLGRGRESGEDAALTPRLQIQISS